MTVPWPRGLLVSVRDAEEAAVAAAAGAAIIDIKEPRNGPLGRADAAVAAAAVVAVGGRAPVTLACGELAVGSEAILSHVADVLRLLPAAVSPPIAVKAGPAGLTIASWCDAFRRLQDQLPAGLEGVAVAYADWPRAQAPPPDVVLAEAGRAGAVTLLIDTFDKRGPGLWETSSPQTIAAWTAAAAAAGLAVAVAGRLTAAEVPLAFRIGARVVGVRTAACAGGREGRISAPLVRQLGTLSRFVAGPAFAGR